MKTIGIVVVDQDAEFAHSYQTLLSAKGYEVLAETAAEDALKAVERLSPSVIILDLGLPTGGADLISELLSRAKDACVIATSSDGAVRAALAATRSGADEFLRKPVDPEVMYAAVARAVRRSAPGASERPGREEDLTDTTGWDDRDFGYPAPAMRAAMMKAYQAATGGGLVLLLGESGTGKDFIARWIHKHSPRAEGPFFGVNCAALPAELAESELFGHEPGAFTGARARKRGLVELAERGTLLLDEIGELDAALQAKLLTFLDTRQFVRVGGERMIEITARIITATNRDLLNEVDQGRFRKDLYYRINVFPIRLPPLRDRIDDLPVLVDEILACLQQELGLPRIPPMERGVLEVLAGYEWPGNVRELRNVIERALMLSRSKVLRKKYLLGLTRMKTSSGDWEIVVEFPPKEGLHEVTRSVARQLVSEALRRTESKQEAAKLLGISRHALAHQIRTLGLE